MWNKGNEAFAVKVDKFTWAIGVAVSMPSAKYALPFTLRLLIACKVWADEIHFIVSVVLMHFSLKYFKLGKRYLGNYNAKIRFFIHSFKFIAPIYYKTRMLITNLVLIEYLYWLEICIRLGTKINLNDLLLGDKVIRSIICTCN